MNNTERVLLIVAALVVGLLGGVVSARLMPQRRTTVVAKEIVLLDQQGDVCASVSAKSGLGVTVVFKDREGKVIGTFPPTSKVMPLHE